MFKVEKKIIERVLRGRGKEKTSVFEIMVDLIMKKIF